MKAWRSGRLHCRSGGQSHYIHQSANGSKDGRNKSERGGPNMKIGALDENDEREPDYVPIELRDVSAEPGSGSAADQDTDDGDDHDKFNVVPCYRNVAVSERLQ